MTTHAIAIQPTGWTVLQGRWLRALGSGIVLLLAALFVQPPVSTSTGVPAKADPVLYARAASHPSQAYSVIVREATPASSAAEDMVRSLGGMPLVGSPVRLDGERADSDLPPPALGEHTVDVLTSLGLDDAAIERLKSEKVIG